MCGTVDKAQQEYPNFLGFTLLDEGLADTCGAHAKLSVHPDGEKVEKLAFLVARLPPPPPLEEVEQIVLEEDEW